MNKRKTNLIECTCNFCGKKFIAYMPPSYISEGRGKCCSRQCSGKQSSKITEDNKQHIIALAKDPDVTTSELASMFGCSATKINVILRGANLSRGKSRKGAKNGMYGKTHSADAKSKIREANASQFAQPGARERHAVLTCEQIQSGLTGKAYNRLEMYVAGLLDEQGIEYIQQYRIGRYLFDFYIASHNTLIEVHGTFWHADPRFYNHAELTPIQQRNTSNDIRKALRAVKDGYRFITFWEYDIFSTGISSAWNFSPS